MKRIGWRLGFFLLLLFLPFLFIGAIWHNYFYILVTLVWFSVVGYFMSRWMAIPLKELYEFMENLRLGVPARNRFSRRGDIYGRIAKGLELIERAHTSHLSTLHGRMEEIQAILTSMSEGVVATDITGRISLINPAAAELFNLKPGEGVGEFPYKVFPHSELEEIFHQTYVKGYPLEKEISWHNPERVLNLHLALIRDEVTEEERGVVAVITDITKIRLLEGMRKDFVANVSHELKTPLTSIKGFIETLIDGALEDKESVIKFLTIINQETDRLNKLIADLLDISKLESGRTDLKKKLVNINKLVDEIILTVAGQLKDKQLELKRELKAGSVFADEDLLREVIINLLDNAIKYTPAGGNILMGSNQNSERFEFFIEDNGIGIPEESLPRLFERFYRVDKGRSREMGGTGLGLSIVKHIIERHSGKVTVESKLAKGSRFIFTIPISAKEVELGWKD